VLGLSRQQAIGYMTAHVPNSRAAVESEIGRYIANPGQATAYMIGRLEIERLRDEAEAGWETSSTSASSTTGSSKAAVSRSRSSEPISNPG
jgi:uncharacterized protein (DUF885 family)